MLRVGIETQLATASLQVNCNRFLSGRLAKGQCEVQLVLQLALFLLFSNWRDAPVLCLI